MAASLFSFLFSRLFLGFIGITALAALVWIGGPHFSLVGVHWLESTLNRQIAIGIGYFLWIFFQLIPGLYRAWFNSKLLTTLQPPEVDREEQAVTEEMLASRFSEAIAMLKKTQFPARESRKKQGWLKRFHVQYLYELPWYMIIGAPGAGKTTALVNSGLEFPLSDTLGKTALRGVGGTRHCDWWFTDEAVLLDTAGRYTLQESQRARDASEWQTFISLLKRFRARQPINGVIMTLSVADLLSDSAEARFAQATSLRQRLSELHLQTGIHFPVYVMVTKTDLLKGFMSYFASLDKSQRDRVWGFTFPWQANRQGETAVNTLFEEKFRTLCTRLLDDLAGRMAKESDLAQRAECFLFPQEFASLRPLLAEYLDIVFSPENGEMPWTPRGIFFTSGTQEGLPFDRIMGELTRKLQLPQPVSHSIASWDTVNRNAPIPANREQSYFIHALLSDMIFRESHLAGSDRSWENRNRLLHWIGYGVLGLTLLITTLLWSTSYYKNQQYLDQVAARLPAIEQQAQRLTASNSVAILDLLPFLNSLVALPQSEAFSLDAPPLSLRGGLYRGDQISDAAMGIYQNALKTLLLPNVAKQITATLRSDKGEDSEFSRNALRAYQMLYQPRSYDGEFLRAWVMQNLQRTLPPSVTTRQLQQLDWHLSQLLDRQVQISPFARDNALMMRKLAIHLDNAGQHNDTASAFIPASGTALVH